MVVGTDTEQGLVKVSGCPEDWRRYLDIQKLAPKLPGVVLKLGFGRNMKVDPYKYQLFKKKWHPFICQSAQFFLRNFEQNHPVFQNFLKFEPILAQIWDNFEKSTHSHTKLGSFIYQEADFATQVGSTSPVGSFVLSTHPLEQIGISTAWNTKMLSACCLPVTKGHNWHTDYLSVILFCDEWAACT